VPKFVSMGITGLQWLLNLSPTDICIFFTWIEGLWWDCSYETGYKQTNRYAARTCLTYQST